jgi:hypothetical protein
LALKLKTLVKAIKINAKSRCIEIVDLGPQLSDIYELLECNIMTVAYPQTVEPTSDVIYVDDEGLFKPLDKIPGAFFIDIYPAQPLFGHALIVGTDDEGRNADVNITVEQVSDMIQFLSEEEIKLYQEHLTQPPQVFSF